jgi:D-alanyl-D-alanine carboxypeptidase (penicillin-binding protein 5/6)
MLLLAIGLLSGLLAAPQGRAQPAIFESKAKQALVVEDSTGTVLYAKNPDEVFPPASLLKLATAEYVFNELKLGHITVDTRYKVSEYAWRTGGALSRTSAMFAALNSEIPVIDLLRGVVVQLANDGCIILAEGLAGSDTAFADLLTARARTLGLTKSLFGNSNGLPNPKNVTTVHDMLLMARHIRSTYPDYFKLYAEKSFEWNKIDQRNRNPLIAQNIGVDGFATGFAEGSGYSIVVTAERGGTRLFVVLAGLATDKERAEETRRILDWGFGNFTKRTVFRKDEAIAEAAVFGGDAAHVALHAANDVDIFVPTDNPDRIRARIAYRWPLRAPVEANQKIGVMTITQGDRPLRDVDVYAAVPVGTGSLTSKAFDGLKELLFFWL